jgi:hypothetical protein
MDDKVPYMSTAALPDSIFQLLAGTMQTEPQSGESTVDIINSKSVTPQSTAIKTAGLAGSGGWEAWTQISNFLGHYRPFLAVAILVFVDV